MKLAYLAAVVYPLAAQAGWITFQNENSKRRAFRVSVLSMVMTIGLFRILTVMLWTGTVLCAT